MDINKVEYNGVDGTETLIDLTADTVTPETLVKGATAHDKSGANITGTADYAISSTSTASPLTDSADGMAQVLTIYGRSKKSKNLLEITAESQTINGVTFTVDKAAGTITANGTATATTYFNCPNAIKNLPANTFIMSGVDNGSPSTYFIYLENGTPSIYQQLNSGILEFTRDISTVNIAFSICVKSNVTVSNLVCRPMLCTAADYEADPTFEPYFEGIKSVGDDGLTVQTTGKNLFDITSYPLTESAWIYAETGTAVENEAGTACTLDYIPCALYVGQTLTLNKRPAGNNSGIAFYNASKIFISGIKNLKSTEGTPWTFTVPTGAMFMRFTTVPNNQQIQLELGSTATAYEPYRSTSADYTTALPLRGVSDTVRDKLICTAESKQVETVCGKVRLADLPWQWWNQHPNILYAEVVNKQIGLCNMICSAYPYRQDIDFGFSFEDRLPDKTIYCSGTTDVIFIKNTDYNTQADFVDSLGDAELVYELATPVTTPLTDAEISTFRGLCTYDSTTNITITDEPDFEIDYLKNTANGQAVADIQRDLQGQIDDKITVSPLLTLTAAGWDSTTKQQTVTFAHDTSRRNVIDITIGENAAWDAAGVYAVSETDGGITFECSEIPETALTFRVTSMEVS